MLMTSLICRVTTESMILSGALLRMKQDTINILLQDARIFMEKSGCIVTDQRFSCDPSAKSQRQQSSQNEDSPHSLEVMHGIYGKTPVVLSRAHLFLFYT